MSEKEAQKDNEAGEALPAPARSKKAVMAASGVGALLLITGVPAGYYMMKKEPPKVEEVTVDVTEEENTGKLEGAQDVVELEEGEEALGAIVPLDTFLLNLPDGKYIRVQMQIEFEGLDIPPRFHSRMVPIRDAIISYLTQQKSDELQSLKGKEDVKIVIRKIINDQIRKEDVRRVYFTQFVIQ